MRLALRVTLLAALLIAGCDDKPTAEMPAPHELSSDAVGHYCGMTLVEHPGPKGQIILASRGEPVWFSSARDAFSFTMLPEEPKDVRAIYVSDMGKATNWDDPGARNWTDARQAFFVIDSRRQGGMGAPETVPFSDKAAADRFAAENGGRVVTFAEVPRDYVLGSPDTGGAPATSGAPGHTAGHGH